jgi:hypothetical protein
MDNLVVRCGLWRCSHDNERLIALEDNQLPGCADDSFSINTLAAEHLLTQESALHQEALATQAG